MLYLSGTHATAAQRAAVIRSLLKSDAEAENALGLEAFRTILQCHHFTSHYSFDFGARSRDYGLIPRRGAAIKEWFGEALNLAEEIGLQGGPVASEVRKAVAARFSELCAYVGMMSKLVELADKFAQKSSWPEGWIGVRTTIARHKEKMPPEDREKLEALATRLQANNLEDMVRVYALSKEWGALDFLETQEDSEQDPVKAYERVFEMCVDLGQQLGQSEDKLAPLLPELFASDSQKMLAVGRGVAKTTSSLSRCWQLLFDGYFGQPEGKRHSVLLLGGFIEEAMRRDPHATDSILDNVLADTRLHPHFTWLQCHAGLGEAARARLKKALDIETVPIDTFEQIAYGGASKQIDDDTLADLVRRIIAKEGGGRVGAEIVGMRVLYVKDENQSASEPLKAVARELLRVVRFDEKQRRPHEHMLAGVIKIALTRPEDEEIARRLCARIKEGVKAYQVHASDLPDVIEALAKTFPRAVLDVLVEPTDDDPWTARTLFRDYRENRPCLLDSVPAETLLAWAAEKPQTRYAALAQAVKYADANDDDKVKSWSPIAEKLIEIAPDPVAVLDVFKERFEPMTWSGSRADIFVTRMPLLEKLRNHARPEVAAWAQKAIPDYASEIEHERRSEAKESRGRDERFE